MITRRTVFETVVSLGRDYSDRLKLCPRKKWTNLKQMWKLGLQKQEIESKGGRGRSRMITPRFLSWTAQGNGGVICWNKENKRRKIVKKKMVNSVLILASYQRGEIWWQWIIWVWGSELGSKLEYTHRGAISIYLVSEIKEVRSPGKIM